MNTRLACTIRRSMLAAVIAVVGYLTTPKPAASQWACPLCMMDPWGGEFQCILWYVGAQNCVVFGDWCIMWDECQTIMSVELSEHGSVHLAADGVALDIADAVPEPADGTTLRTCDGILLRRREIDNDISDDDDISERDAPLILSL